MKRLTVMTAFLAAMMLAVQAGASPLLQDGLVSVWSFDEAAGTTTAYDTGGINTNDAIFSLGMTTTGSDFTSGGVLGSYLQFNGSYDPGSETGTNTAAVIAADPSLNIAEQMTFSTWVKMDTHPMMQTSTWAGIFDSLSDAYVLYTESNGEMRMKLVNNAGGYTRVAAPLATVDSIVGSWAHVAVVYDGREDIATTRMYINGSEVSHTWGLSGNLKVDQVAAFGGQYNPATDTAPESYANPFNGGIDETAIWNRALTPDEVSYLYNGGVGNAVMTSNPEIGGTLPGSALGTVASGTPIIKYDFEGNLNNTGSLGAAGNGVYEDGSVGSLTYEKGTLNDGINLNNGDITADGDRIVVPVSLSGMNSGTMSFWLKENQTYFYNSVFNCPAEANDWEMWIYGDQSRTDQYKARIDTGTVQTNPSLNENGFGQNQWNHYTFRWVRDSENTNMAFTQLFLNGEMVSTAESNWVESGAEFYLGGGNGNDYGTWSMDDFQLYNVALDNSAIYEIYNARNAQFTPYFVSSADAVVKYTFDGNVSNSGTGGATYDARMVDGADLGTIGYDSDAIRGQSLKVAQIDSAANTAESFHVEADYMLPDDGTMSFWLKADSFFDYNSVFDNGSDIANGNQWEGWVYSNGQMRLRIDGDSYVTTDLNDFGGEGEWNYVTFRWLRDNDDPTQVALWLFMNGEQVDFDEGAWIDPTGLLGLAGVNPGNDGGTIHLDDFQIFEAALDDAAILAMFEAYAEQPKVAGDANGDGKVDGSDVTILAGNWQKGVNDGLTATWAEGDFNGDGKVDGSDVTILAGNWQYGVEASSASVPEPSTIILLVSALACLGLFRRR